MENQNGSHVDVNDSLLNNKSIGREIELIPLNKNLEVLKHKQNEYTEFHELPPRTRLASLDFQLVHTVEPDHTTNYFETMMHLFKGNVGSGLFAMGDAFKNAGLLTATVLTIALGVICLHSQRLLIKCSKRVQRIHGYEKSPDFSITVELCFEAGSARVRRWSKFMKNSVDIFVCLTQLGFCSIYFVFVSSNLKQVVDRYGFEISTQLYMVIILLPIALSSLIRNLKFIVPFSMIAAVFMVAGIFMTAYYSCFDLPPFSERKNFATWKQLPIYFSTTVFCFEGIALVLPLRNSMKEPRKFDMPLGVHIVGTSLVIAILTCLGFIGYLSYGEDVKGSLTLNLPEDDITSQIIKMAISLAVVLGYALQFYVAIDIMWPSIVEHYGIQKNIVFKEQIFRLCMVFVTFLVAEAIPNLVLLISLVGAVCSSALALMFPPLIDIILEVSTTKSPSKLLIIKDALIILIGFVGFITGTYESVLAIVNNFLSS